MVSDIRRFFSQSGITFSGVVKTINCLVFLIVLLAEANLEPKNTFQLLLSAEISPLESGVDAKVGEINSTKELMALSAPELGWLTKNMLKKSRFFLSKNLYFLKSIYSDPKCL